MLTNPLINKQIQDVIILNVSLYIPVMVVPLLYYICTLLENPQLFHIISDLIQNCPSDSEIKK